MQNIYENVQKAKVDWVSIETSRYTFQAIFNGERFYLRLNDFPDEPLCTIIRDDGEMDIHEFPKNWTLPKHRNGG